MSGLFAKHERDIRSKLMEALQRFGIKQVDVARETGIHHSSLSIWLQGKGKSNNPKIDEQIDNWLNNLYANKPKLAGTVLTRLEMLKGKRERGRVFEEFDDNSGFGNLIPISINIEIEGKKFKEIFFWELNEPYLRVESFAKILVDDNLLPSNFESEIVNQMNKQINQYLKFEKVEGEIIRTIKLDLRIGEFVLTDQFDWDINNPSNSPEEFARNLCADLGLGSDFILPITHSIKEQVLDHQKVFTNERRRYYQLMYNRGGVATGNTHKYVDSSNLFRDVYSDATEWQPIIKKISYDDIKKFEKKEERKLRYVQRKK
jgi:SWI/SNF-related matrix-associated actin-dependent regulator of chromatin subfamily B protein 1